MKPTQAIHIAGQGAFVSDKRIDIRAKLSAEQYENEGYESLFEWQQPFLAEPLEHAGREALSNAKVSAEEVSFVYFSNINMKDRNGWCQAADLARRLGNPEATFLDLYQGCNGIIASMELAIAQMHVQPEWQCGVIATADCFPAPLCNKWTMDEMTFYGDGAGAWLIKRGAGPFQVLSLCGRYDSNFNDFIFSTYGSLSDLHSGFTAKEIAPAKAKRAWLKEHSIRNVIQRFKQNSLDSIHQCLREAGLEHKDLDIVCVPNFSRPLVNNILDDFGFHIDQSLWRYGRQSGHMGSTDPMMNIYRANKDGAIKPGQHILVVTHGAGISSMAMILRT